jgi:hypothetical protein
METFADTSAFNAGVKEKNTKTNKITIVKDQRLPTQNFGRSGWRLLNSTVVFLPDVSDVWRRPNPVKTLNVPFLLQNPQWNQRMNSHEPCKKKKWKLLQIQVLSMLV